MVSYKHFSNVNSKGYATASYKAKILPSTIKGVFKKISKDFLLSLVGNFPFKPYKNALRCFYCHWVFDDNLAQFDKIINSLLRVGHFVTTKECIEIINGNKPINANFIHLSFDDGFKNNLNAARVLRNYGVPGCFFVPTEMIEAPYDKVANYCVNIAGYRYPIEMMTWDDLEKLLDWGFDVGSHTRTHARLIDISNSNDQLEKEILGSKNDLESKLKCECKFISWPFGLPEDIDNNVIDKIKGAGYKACFGSFRGKITQAKADMLYKIPRHHFEADWPVSHVMAFASGRIGE